MPGGFRSDFLASLIAETSTLASGFPGAVGYAFKVISSLHFSNFRVLRDATLPVGRCTLLIGPNASGKSTALTGLEMLSGRLEVPYDAVSSTRVEGSSGAAIVRAQAQSAAYHSVWQVGAGNAQRGFSEEAGEKDKKDLLRDINGSRIFALDPDTLGRPVVLLPNVELGPRGENHAAVLDRLRDQAPENFERLCAELHRWMPEYDRVLFETPSNGYRSFQLRTTGTKHPIAASALSQGTRLALALLTLAYLPSPPPIIGIEEPDRGIHPRLLRDVRDAVYRLAYPEDFKEQRAPVQVILTTHSPYLLDLFREHPDEIVISQRKGDSASFEKLSDRKDLDSLLENSTLSEVWYSGILGGVPADR